VTGEQRAISLRRRIQAAFALLALPLAAVACVVGFVLGLPELFIAAVVVAPTPACLWRALGRRGASRWAWVLAAAGFICLSLWLVWLADRGVLLVFTGAGLGLIGAAAGASALYHVPRGDQTRLRRSQRRIKRPVLFLNERSGGGTAVRVALRSAAEARGIKVVVLQPGDDLSALVRSSIEGGADCVGAAGGDGTQAAVGAVAAATGVPFVCVPVGTRNHFALDLGLDRDDPIGALDAFESANSIRIDLAEVNGCTFVNNVSVGAYGEVVAEQQYREHKFGTALQRLPDLVGPDAVPLGLSFVDSMGRTCTDAVVLMVSNNRYDLSPRPGFGSRPTLRDGQLGVVVVEPAPSLLGPVKVSSFEASSFDVNGGGVLRVGLDGEALEMTPPLRFRSRPGVLRVRLPTHAPGLSPSALRPPLGPERFGELWSVARGVPPGSQPAQPLA
jgi:diacylglycerol kinase family enzyme